MSNLFLKYTSVARFNTVKATTVVLSILGGVKNQALNKIPEVPKIKREIKLHHIKGPGFNPGLKAKVYNL